MTCIGDAIRALRILHDLRQKEFAERVGMAKSYLCQLEKGKKMPSFLMMKQISGSFGIPIHHFIILSDEIDPEEEISKDELEKLPKIIRLILNLREFQRDIRKKEA